MPRKAPHGCHKIGCPNLTRRRFCEDHEREQLDAERARREEVLTQQGKRGSKLYRQGVAWRQLRKRHLKGQPFCVVCAVTGARVPATDVDHVIPHCNDTRLFFDPTNLQSLCKAHHSAKTAREVGFIGGGKTHARSQ